ncbi:LOW QUALITY PROTEIN: uncharacterized protein LOC120380857 [Mauremys reevesii]|uniref:LOW QUALITY PROTEIN: uncharacterized protein LOC120380857 n=1 Tax=Mauremys reevesii TaxID=260615 RepID=UPI00193F752C|nr:LOW QUALITY PROTEIN: uncharacterized protein LOC120380857 [Mauremys reevesii]
MTPSGELSLLQLVRRCENWTANPRPPSVFPLVPCGPKTGNAPLDTSLACLVTGYFPAPVAIKWNSGKVTQGVTTFPEVMMSDGLHSQSSLLVIPARSRQGDTYQCDVMHQGSKDLWKKFPQKWCVSTTPPQVHLLVPTCEESSTESQLELVCLLLSFKPGNADVKWLVNGKESSSPTPSFSSAMGTDGFYMGQSRMNITKQSWEQGDVYSCQVTHPAVGAELSMHNTSKCLACLRSSLDPTIYLTKPSYEDVIKNSGHVTCLVLGYDLAASRMAWKVDGQVSSAAKTEPPKKNSNGTTSLVSSHPVSLAQWGQGTKFTCKVTTPCSGELTQDITMSNTGEEPWHLQGKAEDNDREDDLEGDDNDVDDNEEGNEDAEGEKEKECQNAEGDDEEDAPGLCTPERAALSYHLVPVDIFAQPSPQRLLLPPPGVSNCNRHPLEVSLLPPSLEDLYIAQNATISCLVSGLETPGSLEVFWNRGSGGPLAVVSRDPVLQEDGTYSATSILRVCVEEWQAGEEFICTVKHQDFPSAIVKTVHKSHMVSLRAPSVYISPPHAEELALWESATITCLASGFRPRDILVTWTQQDRPMPQEAYTNIGSVREDGKEERYFIYSKLKKLNVLVSKWEPGDTYACVVGHEGLPMTFIHWSVDKASGKPTAVNVSVILSDTDVTCY